MSTFVKFTRGTITRGNKLIQDSDNFQDRSRIGTPYSAPKRNSSSQVFFCERLIPMCCSASHDWSRSMTRLGFHDFGINNKDILDTSEILTSQNEQLGMIAILQPAYQNGDGRQSSQPQFPRVWAWMSALCEARLVPFSAKMRCRVLGAHWHQIWRPNWPVVWRVEGGIRGWETYQCP